MLESGKSGCHFPRVGPCKACQGVRHIGVMPRSAAARLLALLPMAAAQTYRESSVVRPGTQQYIPGQAMWEEGRPREFAPSAPLRPPFPEEWPEATKNYEIGGDRDDDPPPARFVHGKLADPNDPAVIAVCEACRDVNQHDFAGPMPPIPKDCFQVAVSACAYDPDDVDPAVSRRVSSILRKFSFCVGWTARTRSDVSRAALMRITQWKAGACTYKQPRTAPSPPAAPRDEL